VTENKCLSDYRALFVFSQFS